MIIVPPCATAFSPPGEAPLRGGPVAGGPGITVPGVCSLSGSAGVPPGGPAALNEITIRRMSKGGRELTGVWSQTWVPPGGSWIQQSHRIVKGRGVRGGAARVGDKC